VQLLSWWDIYVLNIYAHKTALETRRQLLRPCFHIKSYTNLIPAESKQSLLGSTVTSIFFYYLTPPVVPLGTINFINKMERAFLWSAKKTTTEAKCKVNWETMCHPKKLRGLGVMNLDKVCDRSSPPMALASMEGLNKKFGGPR
jgi:hypothetical protein